MSADRCIVTLTNNAPEYQRYLWAYVTSLRQNAPKEEMRAYVANWDKDAVDELKKRNCRCKVIPLRMPGANWLRVVHRSAEVLLQTMQMGYSRVAFSDTDILIRADITELFVGVGPDTLKVVYRPKHFKKRRVQNGVYCVGVGKYTLAMVEAMQRKLAKSETWYDDQLQLWKQYHRRRNKVKLIPLSDRYNDKKFRDNSPIWHCARKNKTAHKSWNMEMRRYLWRC